MNFDIDMQTPFMEFVIHVMNNEEERVNGIPLLVLNIRKKTGSYEKKLSHWTKSFLDKNIRYFKEVKRAERVFFIQRPLTLKLQRKKTFIEIPICEISDFCCFEIWLVVFCCVNVKRFPLISQLCSRGQKRREFSNWFPTFKVWTLNKLVVWHLQEQRKTMFPSSICNQQNQTQNNKNQKKKTSGIMITYSSVSYFPSQYFLVFIRYYTFYRQLCSCSRSKSRRSTPTH